MRCVFVKHYLNEDGMEYFSNTWFPAVNKAVTIQPGFVEITSQRDVTDPQLVHILLSFQNEETLLSWVGTKLHDDLVDNLDDFRVRDWEFAAIDVSNEQPIDRFSNLLNWEHATPRTIVYNRSPMSM